MKRSSKQPKKFKLLEFEQSTQRQNIYDLIKTSTKFDKFKYFKLEIPLQSYLLKQGANFVCESWEQNVKTLHTGLIPTGDPGYFIGDFVELVKGVKKTSLIIFRFKPELKIIQLYYFNRFNLKSVSKRLEFARVFINGLNVI